MDVLDFSDSHKLMTLLHSSMMKIYHFSIALSSENVH